jgi:hypothetical protein
MAIRFFGEGHCGVVDWAHDALRNRLGRFTLGNLQGGGRSALFFLSPLAAAQFLRFEDTGSFKNREVKDRFIRLNHG